MQSRTRSAFALAATLLAFQAHAALTLYTPIEGAFLKSPSAITYQATGVQSATAASVTLTATYYSQTAWWYKYNGSLLAQTLTVPPPNNAWVTATLKDGSVTSSRRYWTAFPWSIPSSVGQTSATTAFGTFPKGYCTNFAARAFFSGPSITASYVPWSGNAKAWVANAGNSGWKTTTSTTDGMIGAVIVWSSSSFGHVGVVVDMNKTGVAGEIEYTIKEMNWGELLDPVNAITTNFGKVTEKKLKSSSLARSSTFPFSGFILPVRK